MHAQGLLDDPARSASPAVLRRMIERMGFVQIDSINVIERAHHLTLRSRLANYRREHLRVLHEARRDLFEHWTHDASLIPVAFFAHWHHRKKRFAIDNPRVHAWLRKRLGKDSGRLIDEVLARIDREGPMQSRDFEHSPGQTGAWWGWKPAKAALEYLWWRGDLSVSARINFQKVYDLTERAYPDHHHLEAPDEEEFIDWACRESLDRLVFATSGEIAEFFGTLSRSETARWTEQAHAAGLIERVSIESADNSPPRESFAVANWSKRVAAATRAFGKIDHRLRFLSPFDPVLRDRSRAKRLFDFDYRFEAFVPEPKRTYGYYVLPILERDRLIGRCDLKLHRKHSELEVKGVWWEPGVRATRRLERAFDEAVDDLEEFALSD